MTIGNRILNLRREKGITQEALAQALNVTNQAVSKWESDQCLPDTMLLPRIADYFEISVDALFGRAAAAAETELPWEEDGVLRAVLFSGRKLLQAEENPRQDLSLRYVGPAVSVQSALSVQCDEVRGDVKAGQNVSCDEVGGNVSAGENVSCDRVCGDAAAGGSVSCDEIQGNVRAETVVCDEICGSVVCGTRGTFTSGEAELGETSEE